jgi:hypothetical protein
MRRRAARALAIVMSIPAIRGRPEAPRALLDDVDGRRRLDMESSHAP